MTLHKAVSIKKRYVALTPTDCLISIFVKLSHWTMFTLINHRIWHLYLKHNAYISPSSMYTPYAVCILSDKAVFKMDCCRFKHWDFKGHSKTFFSFLCNVKNIKFRAHFRCSRCYSHVTCCNSLATDFTMCI